MAKRGLEHGGVVQLAIAHVEFEALHPCRDGNGRLGRMRVPLFLYRRALLGSTSFDMSAYFERHRDEYIERLRAVSDADAWTEWCRFFLDGVTDQAAENERKVRAKLACSTRPAPLGDAAVASTSSRSSSRSSRVVR